MEETAEKRIDKLNRGDFVKFIENLIHNSDNYKRNEESDSYVMALDSAWGTGKSYFIDLLIDDINEQDNIYVVKYNAWKNDYCDNAFNPLIYDILKSEALKLNTETEADISNTKKMLSSISRIGLALGKQIITKQIENNTGINVEQAFEEAIKDKENIKNFMFRTLENLEQINTQRESFDELKQALNNAVKYLEDEKAKLVVIIDELDRCKPTFAIQTMEIVKHLFDIKNIVFLFAVDIEQLSHSISCVYGQDFDSVGYLCRFFDYIAKMPNPDIEKYIMDSMEQVGFDEYQLKSSEVGAFMIDISKEFTLSLRDIDTIMQSYRVLYDTKLKEYKMVDAHIVYLYYLVLKYKKPDVYYKLLIDKNIRSTDRENMIYKDFLNKYDNSYLNKSLSALLLDHNLDKCNMDFERSCIVVWKSIGIDSVDGNEIRIKNSLQTTSITNDSTWGQILFAPDFYKWEEVKCYTYREYIYKQLENYNFSCLDTKIGE